MKGKEKDQRYLKRDYDHYHFTVKEFVNIKNLEYQNLINGGI